MRFSPSLDLEVIVDSFIAIYLLSVKVRKHILYDCRVNQEKQNNDCRKYPTSSLFSISGFLESEEKVPKRDTAYC